LRGYGVSRSVWPGAGEGPGLSNASPANLATFRGSDAPNASPATSLPASGRLHSRISKGGLWPRAPIWRETISPRSARRTGMCSPHARYYSVPRRWPGEDGAPGSPRQPRLSGGERVGRGEPAGRVKPDQMHIAQ
jgi:hypothetical protein